MKALNPTQAQASHGFRLLENALKAEPLPTEKGGRRMATAAEFMLMDLCQGFYRFKHSDTRNYLLVRIGDGSVVIPEQNKPFLMGKF